MSSLRHQGDPTFQLPAGPRGIFDRVDRVGRCSHVLKLRLQRFKEASDLYGLTALADRRGLRTLG